MESFILLLLLLYSATFAFSLLPPPCIMEPENINLKSSNLESKIRNANFIFTAKVEALLSNGDVGLLLIKRVYKSTDDGHKYDIRTGRMIRVSGFLVPFDTITNKKGGNKSNDKKGENISRRHILDPYQRLEAQRRHRRGGAHAASPRGCLVVRVRDTKLFMVSLDRRERTLHLDAKPLAMTMKALEITGTTLTNLKGKLYN